MALVSDDDLLARIDDELRDALSVTPSPQFLPRVRERLARTAPSPTAPLLRWLAPAALAAAALLVVVLQSIDRADRAPSAPAAATATRPLPPPVGRVQPALPRAGHAAVARVRAGVSPTRPRAPEVLVSPAEESALEQFIAAVVGRRLDGELFASAETVAPREIAIAPIEIKPLRPER
jgi:hypothetical protein